MFYSQFILAKKGPLGTIWIAAHLERKLRKNQVADTDIGVSVDSILFPEVPIALRLSSHLLLGVVRIYSRKVNYLFHDCSEALLNIKQAFRSTAVDLPPEQSTAPYHSITLPETFHLDDFELPDTAFQGDFVDHHISTKEQITLQDNLERTEYSTSKFGLDERFGDGNASHIGLDLEEDLFLDKDQFSHHASSQLISDEGTLLQGQSSVPLLRMDIKDDQHGSDADGPSVSGNSFSGMSGYDKQNLSMMEDFRRHGNPSNWHAYNIQTPDLNEIYIGGPSTMNDQTATPFPIDEAPSPNLIECAHAPSTPGLVEETIPSRVRESPTLSPPRRASPSSNDDSKADNSTISTSQFVHPSSAEVNGAIPALMVEHVPVSVDTAQVLSLPIAALTEPEAISSVQEGSCANFAGVDEHLMECDPKIDNDGSNSFLDEEKDTDHIQYTNETGEPQVTPSDHIQYNNENGPDAAEGNSPSKLAKENLGELPIMETMSSNPAADKTLPIGDASVGENFIDLCTRESTASLEPSVGMNLLDVDGSSLEIRGEDPSVANAVGADVDMHQSSDHLVSDVVYNNKMQNELSVSEFPEPEKMLLAPNIDSNQEYELRNASAEKIANEFNASVNRMSTLSGKKRRLADSLLLPEKGFTGNLSSKPRLRKNTEFVPDDDDLLASILVGKRTLGLRIGPTPPPNLASLKRSRLAPKTGVHKRKVLLDDFMVLHADVIRQQLINTDDIRRVRKKAPCTRPEIWMIENSPLEDEIFNDSMFNGASAELNGLQHRHLNMVANGHYSHVPLPNEIQATSQEGGMVARTSTTLDNELQEVQGSNSSTLHDPPRFEQSNADRSCPVLQMEINDPNMSAASSLPEPSAENGVLQSEAIAGSRQVNALVNDGTFSEWNVDLCMPGQQLGNNLIRPPSDLSEMNDKPLHINENPTADESLEITVCNDPEGEMCLPPDYATERDAKVSSPIVPAEGFEPGHAAPVEEMKDELDNKVEGEGITFESKENPVSEITVVDEVSAFPLQAAKEDENVVSTVGENSGLQENNIQCGMDRDGMGNDVAPKEFSDFCSAIEAVDTEFLNVDDEVDYEEESNDIPNPEEFRSLENSGWSSRTRSVARYLKTLFDDESGHGRKNIAIDHLLSGKTRKEASRMFFETLVLKSRDYIHVEQGNPFELINIKPGIKLVKSDF